MSDSQAQGQPDDKLPEMTKEQTEAFFNACVELKAKFPTVLVAVCLGYDPYIKGSVAVMAQGTRRCVKAIGVIAVQQAPDVLKFMREHDKVREEEALKNHCPNHDDPTNDLRPEDEDRN